MTPAELTYYLIVYVLFTTGRAELYVSPEPMSWEVCQYHVKTWSFLAEVDKGIALVNANCERNPGGE